MKLARKALPVLSILNNLNRHYGKLYCYPSQERILGFLKQSCSLGISRRQLNYDLKSICNSGLLIRVRRHRRTKTRGMEFHSTLYKITLLGYNLLCRTGVLTWGALKGIQKQINRPAGQKRTPCAKKPEYIGLTSISDVLGGAIQTPGII